MAHLSGARHGAKAGALVGAVGGLLFVVLNAGATAFPLLLRAVGVVLFVVAVVLVVRAPDLALEQQRTRGQMRAYGWIVLAEVVAIPVGASLLLNVFGVDNASLPWVALVLGVHFVGFEKVFPHAGFVSLGVVLTLLGVVGLALAIAGAGGDLITVLCGVLSGFVLLAWVFRGVAAGLGTRTS